MSGWVLGTMPLNGNCPRWSNLKVFQWKTKQNKTKQKNPKHLAPSDRGETEREIPHNLRVQFFSFQCLIPNIQVSVILHHFPQPSITLPGGDKHLIGRMGSQPMKSDAEPDPRAYLPHSDFRTWHSQFELDCQGHHFGSFPLSYFQANRRHHLPYNPYIYYDLLSNSIIPALSLVLLSVPFFLSARKTLNM